MGEENGGGGGIVSSIPGLSTEQTSILKLNKITARVTFRFL
ncbi:WSSV374 [White spot syndrome virus]|uniref:WSSV374 n=1 Tax=White spot syndrome virus TaxID=342409 RepID=A0A2I6SC89_9VIRU|nr:WSSV374 [White spot syndrome virus]